MDALWLIQRGSSQFTAPDAATFEEWVAAGRIAEDDYVYNPILARWLLARETPEFRRGRQQRQGHGGKIDRHVIGAVICSVIFLIMVAAWWASGFESKIVRTDTRNAPNATPAAKPIAETTAKVARTPSPQPDRVELGSVNEGSVTPKRTDVESAVAAMIEHHVITSIIPDRFEAQVSPAFWDSVDLTTKRGIVITIAAYCKIHEPSTGGAVTIKSSNSGQKLAEYSVWSGVKIASDD
ncbi:MAG TPA: hypothetical protein VNN08_00895 [Thermoanaerobaculia bacterium]|nr:hypothetical protein [Thermoanaerobaculia bacterium]